MFERYGDVHRVMSYDEWTAFISDVKYQLSGLVARMAGKHGANLRQRFGVIK